MDIGALRPAKRRSDGTVVAEALLARCGVQEYLEPDGTTRRELRLPEDVFAPESLASFAQVPVCDDHPPSMLTADNARDYTCGATGSSVVPDDDHVRSTIAVFDGELVRKMEAGKLQVSNGYTCDLEETPGVHPTYGPYDAIQRNIVGNHVAVVDHGRAGTARMRLDGASIMVEPAGTPVASRKKRATMKRMATAALAAKTDGTAQPLVDPNDEANRNARGANDAPVDDSFDPDDDDGVDPDDDDEQDAYDTSYEDGELTEAARHKMASSNFAVPDKEKLPIHDKPHVKAAMSRFAGTDFESPEEKHAAFNRIKGRAKQFGVSTKGFEKAHAGKLDKKDKSMTDAEKMAAAKAAKKAARAAEMQAVTARADAADKRVKNLENDLEAAKGKIASLEKDVETARAEAANASKVHADASDARVDARVDLLTRARATGAKFDSRGADRAIKLAVIQHVDKTDPKTLEGKHDAYIDALFDGAVGRHAATGNALAGARQIVEDNHRADADKAAGVGTVADDDTDENAAKAKFDAANRSYWRNGGRAPAQS